MAEMLVYTFMQRALLAAFLAGALCSTVAFFVVLKRLSFLGVGISHAALGGIAVGVVTGVNPVLSGGIFAVLTATAVGFISRNGKMHEDTAIGIIYAAGMALGIALISTVSGYYPELFSLLFGNILAVSAHDLWLLAGVLAGVLIFLLFFFKKLLAICFDEEMAAAAGLPVNLLYLGLLAAMGLTVIVTARLVGTVLVSALLVIPAATGYRLCSNYRSMLLVSLATGIAGSVGGLIISFYWRIPPGAAIVLLTTLFFCLSWLKSLRPRVAKDRKT